MWEPYLEHLYGRLYGTSIWGGWRILLIRLFSLDPLSQKYTHGNLEGMYKIGSLLWEPYMGHLHGMLDGYMEWTLWSPDALSLKLEGFVWDFWFAGSSVPEPPLSLY